MNANLITCPQCGHSFALSDALTHQIRDHLKAELQADVAKREAEAKRKLEEVRTREEALVKAKETLNEEVEKQLKQKLAEAEARATKKVEGKFADDLKELQESLKTKEASLKAYRENERELRKQKEALETEKAEFDIKLKRQLDTERETIRKQAAETAAEAERLKVAEKEKVISDLQLQITVLKQKAEQGSMQLQGEVLELDLESQLAAAFPHDTVEPVGKGVKGGDIHQRVRTSTGNDCGMIIWEAKRTKNWSGSWAPKVKEDQRAAKAELAVIVSQALPPELKHFGQVDGVWVCDSASALPLAAALRQGLVTAAMARLAETGKAGKMEELYNYLCGVEFRQHVEAVVESFVAMQQDLQKERRAMEKSWAAREKQLDRALQHTAQLYGGIQGIAGRSALPEIKTLELPPSDANGAEVELNSL
jgi:hypothetical protein